MATRLDFRVSPAPFPNAHDELNDLIETLHRSGTLRVINGFFGQLGPVTDVALTELETAPGRNLIGSLLWVAECLTKIRPEELQRVSQGLATGVQHASKTLADEPPSTLGLLRLLREPETRRALAASLVLLRSLGAALRPDEPPLHPAKH